MKYRHKRGVAVNCCPELETFSVLTFKYQICEYFSSGRVSMRAELQQGKQVDVYPSLLVAFWVSACHPTHFRLVLWQGPLPNEHSWRLHSCQKALQVKEMCFHQIPVILSTATWTNLSKRKERSEAARPRCHKYLCDVSNSSCRARCFCFVLTSAILIPVQKCSRTTVAKRLMCRLKRYTGNMIRMYRCADRQTDNLRKCFLSECAWHCLSYKESQPPVSVPACRLNHIHPLVDLLSGMNFHECGCNKGNRLETSILVPTEIFYFSKMKKKMLQTFTDKNATDKDGYLFKIVRELFIVGRTVECRDYVRWVGPLTKRHYRNVVNVSQGTRRWSVHINPGLWLTDKTGPSSCF